MLNDGKWLINHNHKISYSFTMFTDWSPETFRFSSHPHFLTQRAVWNLKKPWDFRQLPELHLQLRLFGFWGRQFFLQWCRIQFQVWYVHQMGITWMKQQKHLARFKNVNIFNFVPSDVAQSTAKFWNTQAVEWFRNTYQTFWGSPENEGSHSEVLLQPHLIAAQGSRLHLCGLTSVNNPNVRLPSTAKRQALGRQAEPKSTNSAGILVFSHPLSLPSWAQSV